MVRRFKDESGQICIRLELIGARALMGARALIGARALMGLELIGSS
jgi:hypothetical protein